MSALKLLALTCPRFPALERGQTPAMVRRWSRIARHLAETGCTTAEAARFFGVDRSTVRRALIRYGPVAATIRLVLVEADRMEKGGAA